MVFDGNSRYAVPLSQEGLDWCCSSDDTKCKFVEFVKSFSLPNFDAYCKQFDMGDKLEKDLEKQEEEQD